MEAVLADITKRNAELGDLLEQRLSGTAFREDLDQVRHELVSVLERLGAASSSGAEIDYVQFENRFRGVGGELKERQRPYLQVLPPPSSAGRVLDVGCGRGEMLELLGETGHDAFGVDTDEGMVEECRRKGLNVVHDHAIALLERLANDSLKGVFCAQVVEHLLTSELHRFVELSFEKIRPGGVLVIETINPRSSFALGEHFYADPSHVRPVHPETLRFLCEEIGFSSVTMEELSPHPAWEMVSHLPRDDRMAEAVRSLVRSVFGYQDYSIIATK
jgi:O-antigen chain-terminating methyltransferase